MAEPTTPKIKTLIPDISKHLKTKPIGQRKLGSSVTSKTERDEASSALSTPGSELDEEGSVTSDSSGDCEFTDAIRTRGGYRLLEKMQRMPDSNVEALLAGHFAEKEVIHIVTRLERFLIDTEIKTSEGYKFLLHRADKLVLPSEIALESDVIDDDVVKDGVMREEVVKEEVIKDDVIKDDVIKGDVIKDNVAMDEVPRDGMVEDAVVEDEVIDSLGDVQPPSTLATNTKPEKPKGYIYEEFFTIKNSAVGGLGAFAVKDLKRGDVVLIEKPILLTNSFDLLRDFRALDEETQKVYLSLHPVEDYHGTNLIERIKRANAFQMKSGVAIFAIAARFNHGCGKKRNIKYFWDDHRKVMSFVVCHDIIRAGAELMVTYGGTPTTLFRTFGFRCNCGGCDGLSDKDVERLRAQEFGNFYY